MQQTREWFDLNVGAFARFDVVVDFTRIGAVPTVSTTLVNSPTWTQCLLDGTPIQTNAAGPDSPDGTQLEISPPVPLPASVLESDLPTSSQAAASSFSTVFVHTLARGSNFTATVSDVASTAIAGYTSDTPTSESLDRSVTSAAKSDLVTSTVFSTTVYTITSCAADVINCPASWEQQIIVTRTVNSFTTVCPSGAEVTFPAEVPSAAPSSQAAGSPSNASEDDAVAYVHIITDLVVLVPCETPIVNSFVEPTTRKPPTQHTIMFEEPLASVVPANVPVVIAGVDLDVDVVGGASSVSRAGNGTVATPSGYRSGSADPTGSVVDNVAKPSEPIIAGASRVGATIGGFIAGLAILHFL